MLNEVKSARVRQIPQFHFYVEPKTKWDKGTNTQQQQKQKQTHRYREQSGGCQRGGVGGWAKQVKGVRGTNFRVTISVSHRDGQVQHREYRGESWETERCHVRVLPQNHFFSPRIRYWERGSIVFPWLGFQSPQCCLTLVYLSSFGTNSVRQGQVCHVSFCFHPAILMLLYICRVKWSPSKIPFMTANGIFLTERGGGSPLPSQAYRLNP